MKVDVYIIIEEGRAFVSAWPPLPDRAAALRARGAIITHAVVEAGEPE